MATLDPIIIYSDGACSGNPGPGGWGSIIYNPVDEVIFELGDGDPKTTNNRMEMTAAIEALKSVEKINREVLLFTDSTYLIRGITQWVWGWKKRGWKTADGAAVNNQDLWEKLIALTQKHKEKIHWNYVRGHQGVPGNERCDDIAVAFSKNEIIHLHNSNPNSYPFDVLNLPKPEPLPEMKPNSEKKKVFSYLSLVNGVVTRHADWASCEKSVKGVSGAKFKKTHSADEEADVLKSWGIK